MRAANRPYFASVQLRSTSSASFIVDATWSVASAVVITDSSIKVSLSDPSSGLTSTYDWEIASDKLTYSELISNSTGDAYYLLQGTLTK